MMSCSDDILRQFPDGALDDAKQREIEAAMLSDAEFEARIMGLDDLAAACAIGAVKGYGASIFSADAGSAYLQPDHRGEPGVTAP